MTKCECEKCQPASPKHSYSPAFRLECEARTVLSWPAHWQTKYLQTMPEKRRAQLEQELARQKAAHKSAS